MKKSLGLILRITSYILTTILLVSTLIGCSDNEVNSPDVLESADWVSTIPFDIPNHIYDIESSPFPKFPLSDGSKRDTRNHIIEDDVIFFTAIGDIRKYTQTNDTDEIIVNNSDDYIFSINIKDMEATKLPGYTPSVPPESVIEEETALHRTRISAMHIDNDKAFYIIENLFIETYTLPESMYTYIRKLDSTGKDLIEPIPVSEIVNINDRQQVIATDSQGNIYLGLSDQDKSQVHILNPNGELRFSLNVPQMFQNHLISMPNGNVALFNFAGDMGSELTEIDVASGSWGEKKIVTSNRVFPLQGSAGYPLIFYDFNKTKLSGYNPDNDEITELLNFTDSGIVFDLISGADILNDGRILLITDTINEETDKIDYSVLQVTASIFDPSEIAILTLAAIDSSIILDMEIHKAVAEFNRASTTHFIQVINYAMNKSGIH
ncbi:MAG: hypothetical protein FWD38_08645, partial [Oscillospiraceae bacterium]|nr:hypothetical protein [Oscillospiraceae bacterium]